MCRTCILHADMDAFYASVAQRDDPTLRGRPVIVGGGVVMAASYEARRYGVRGGMGGAQARRLCPDAVVAQPSWQAYVEASRALFAVLHRVAPIVERLSMEEAFLDVGGLAPAAGSPRDIAVRLRREVREQIGLPITVGVACTKIVAKMASRAAKPDGLLVVPAGAERAFLHPLKLEQLWGIGRATAAKLHAEGLRTVGDLACLGEPQLVAILGKGSGRHVHALSPRTVIGGRFRPTAPAARSAPSGRSAARAVLPTTSMTRSPRWSTASRGGWPPPATPGARCCCACASTTTRG